MKKTLNEITSERLHGMKLTKKAMGVVSTTDINVMYECFGNIETEEEMEQFVADTYVDNIDDETMKNISSYMDDEIREDLHAELAPCTNERFLIAYLDRDPDFAKLLDNEFDITI